MSKKHIYISADVVEAVTPSQMLTLSPIPAGTRLDFLKSNSPEGKEIDQETDKDGNKKLLIFTYTDGSVNFRFTMYDLRRFSTEVGDFSKYSGPKKDWILNDHIIITGYTPRLSKEGQVVYPIDAYNGAASFKKSQVKGEYPSQEMWDALHASGLVKDPKPYLNFTTNLPIMYCASVSGVDIPG